MMNKTELINFMAEELGITKVEAEKSIKNFTTTIDKALQKGEKIQLVGFGTFSVDVRDAREAQNPQNRKETINVPAKVYPKFSFGKSLKDGVAEAQAKNVKKMLKAKKAK